MSQTFIKKTTPFSVPRGKTWIITNIEDQSEFFKVDRGHTFSLSDTTTPFVLVEGSYLESSSRGTSDFYHSSFVSNVEVTMLELVNDGSNLPVGFQLSFGELEYVDGDSSGQLNYRIPFNSSNGINEVILSQSNNPSTEFNPSSRTTIEFTKGDNDGYVNISTYVPNSGSPDSYQNAKIKITDSDNNEYVEDIFFTYHFNADQIVSTVTLLQGVNGVTSATFSSVTNGAKSDWLSTSSNSFDVDAAVRGLTVSPTEDTTYTLFTSPRGGLVYGSNVSSPTTPGIDIKKSIESTSFDIQYFTTEQHNAFALPTLDFVVNPDGDEILNGKEFFVDFEWTCENGTAAPRVVNNNRSHCLSMAFTGDNGSSMMLTTTPTLQTGARSGTARMGITPMFVNPEDTITVNWTMTDQKNQNSTPVVATFSMDPNSLRFGSVIEPAIDRHYRTSHDDELLVQFFAPEGIKSMKIQESPYRYNDSWYVADTFNYGDTSGILVLAVRKTNEYSSNRNDSDILLTMEDNSGAIVTKTVL